MAINENKQKLMDTLKKMGFDLKIKVDTVETYYHLKQIGILKVYILLNNKVNVLIETSGSGTYYITLAKKEWKYSEVSIRVVMRQFQTYVKACERFVTYLN